MCGRSVHAVASCLKKLIPVYIDNHYVGPWKALWSETGCCFHLLKHVVEGNNACIYKGQENPISKWSFTSTIPRHDSPHRIKQFMKDFRSKHGLDIRCKDLATQTFKVNFSYKRLRPEPDFSNGRLFVIGTQKEFEIALTPLNSPTPDYELMDEFIIDTL